MPPPHSPHARARNLAGEALPTAPRAPPRSKNLNGTIQTGANLHNSPQRALQQLSTAPDLSSVVQHAMSPSQQLAAVSTYVAPLFAVVAVFKLRGGGNISG